MNTRKHLIAAAIALVSVTATAQTIGSPPVQPPAGEPGKFQKFTEPSSAGKTAPANASAPPKKNLTKAERRAARKLVREQRVGPKPLD